MRLCAEKEIIKCPKCDVPMVYKDGYWKCPLCDGEFWESETTQTITAAELRCAELLERSRVSTHHILSYGMSHFVPLPAGVPVPGKGGSKAGKKRKRALHKTAQIYFYQ